MGDKEIQLQAKEVLIHLIQEHQTGLSFSLKVPKIAELLGASEWAVYEKLGRGEVPGARKIPGIGWRINRDIFLTWLYTQEMEKDPAYKVKV
jgi:predicted DNA-binding transcriptional regulator AlpA